MRPELHKNTFQKHYFVPQDLSDVTWVWLGGNALISIIEIILCCIS